MLGFYQLVIKNPATGSDIKWDVLVMENLFYDRNPTRVRIFLTLPLDKLGTNKSQLFDLKGSMRNRKIQSTGEQNEVLLDENMVEYIYESPLFAREHSKKLLRASVWNDTLFLARQNVMDYSLMIAIDEDRKELVVGIIGTFTLLDSIAELSLIYWSRLYPNLHLGQETRILDKNPGFRRR